MFLEIFHKRPCLLNALSTFFPTIEQRSATDLLREVRVETSDSGLETLLPFKIFHVREESLFSS